MKRLSFKDNKRLFLHLLLMMIVVVSMNNVWMVNGDKSFIIIHDSSDHNNDNNENQMEWDTIRYPYKTVYGIPKSLNCVQSIQQRFYQCEKTSHYEWKIMIDEYFTETKKFCCFIWNTMDCEIPIIAGCNQEYSQKLQTNTKETFEKICNEIDYGPNSLSCWFTEARITAIAIIITTVITFLILVCTFIQLSRAQKAKEAILKKAKAIPGKQMTTMKIEQTKTTTTEAEEAAAKFAAMTDEEAIIYLKKEHFMLDDSDYEPTIYGTISNASRTSSISSKKTTASSIKQAKNPIDDSDASTVYNSRLSDREILKRFKALRARMPESRSRPTEIPESILLEHSSATPIFSRSLKVEDGVTLGEPQLRYVKPSAPSLTSSTRSTILQASSMDSIVPLSSTQQQQQQQQQRLIELPSPPASSTASSSNGLKFNFDINRGSKGAEEEPWWFPYFFQESSASPSASPTFTPPPSPPPSSSTELQYPVILNNNNNIKNPNNI
uniref:Uncharacterized protein LOC113798332 n=1 Tax=Dermatophagoides pteronyssinus TaxID=6956 RepID=A0A6P6YGM2_DERPT